LDYAKRIEAQPTNVSWVDQINIENDASPSPPNQLQGQINETKVAISHILSNLPCFSGDNAVNSSPSTKPSIIPYQINSPADPNLWDSNFALVLLHGIDEYLNGNAKNISCSL